MIKVLKESAFQRYFNEMKNNMQEQPLLEAKYAEFQSSVGEFKKRLTEMKLEKKSELERAQAFLSCRHRSSSLVSKLPLELIDEIIGLSSPNLSKWAENANKGKKGIDL